MSRSLFVTFKEWWLGTFKPDELTRLCPRSQHLSQFLTKRSRFTNMDLWMTHPSCSSLALEGRWAERRATCINSRVVKTAFQSQPLFSLLALLSSSFLRLIFVVTHEFVVNLLKNNLTSAKSKGLSVRYLACYISYILFSSSCQLGGALVCSILRHWRCLTGHVEVDVDCCWDLNTPSFPHNGRMCMWMDCSKADSLRLEARGRGS
jgi:hypothetical protein